MPAKATRTHVVIPYRVRRNIFDITLVVQATDLSRPRVVSVCISLADGEDAPMTKTVDGAVVRKYADQVDGLLEFAFGEFIESITAGSVPATEIAQNLRRTRPRTEVTPAFLKDVARVYKAAVARGDKAPREAVAKQFDKSLVRASQLIRKARDAGYLPDTTDADKKKGRRK